MAGYAVRRLLAAIPILLIVLGGRRVSPELIVQLRAQFGLDGDPITQYVAWLSRALSLDFGTSYKLRQDVGDLIVARAGITIELIALAVFIAVLIGIPLGVVQARRRESSVDYAGSFLAFVGISSPVYFTAIIGILIFAVWLGWLPAFGQGEDPVDQLRHLLLPAVALALGMIALTSRMTRSAMLEVLASDFIEAARAKGLPERSILYKHALRNALIPVLTVISLQVGFLVVGTVLVESTMGLGGLGSLITDAIQNRDYPVIQASVLLLTVLFIVINLLTDLLYAVIDPRIRYS